MQSLEVLEECSNEDNSPQIRRKKALAGTCCEESPLRNCSSSPTNFINCSSRKGKDSLRREQSSRNTLGAN